MNHNIERFKLPVLKNRNGDLSKRWYLEYYLWDVAKNELVRQQRFCPLAYKSAKERRNWANKEIAILSDLLLKGYFGKQQPQPALKTEPIPKSAEPQPTPELIEPAQKATEAILQIVDLKEKINRQRTGQTYRNTFNRFKEFLTAAKLFDLSIDQLKAKHFFNFSDFIIQKGQSNRYRNNMVNDLRTIFNELVKREIILKSPLQLVLELLPFIDSSPRLRIA